MNDTNEMTNEGAQDVSVDTAATGAPVHTLKKPIQHGSETITMLTFREPIAKDLDALPLGKLCWGDLRKLAARLTGHPPTTLETMHPDDLSAVIGITNDLLGGGPATGETS